jgi:putative membrane-bound dehydrogenase-like protein
MHHAKQLPAIVCSAAILFVITGGTAASWAGDANRFRALDLNDPYWVSRQTAQLTTPQWIGEEGVDAVVILGIDDMRGPEKWEQYLRPILETLKGLSTTVGRAPLSIMTCQVDPGHPHLQTWLREGLSLECHTMDHPCPLLARGNLAAARGTYERCVDQMAAVPGSRPVAFRTPCCDSQNTVSPRFFSEIFAHRTPAGNFLAIDSSVFQILTPNDPELPRELVVAEDGTERFRKYLPFRSFVNVIEDYPYPYVIGRTCWEFPCMVPSDWEAQNVLKPANPQGLADLKTALDAVVVKRGVLNYVFHPYGWITSEQVADFVRHAGARYGARLKFLTFREALERLQTHLLAGEPLRNANGLDNGVRLLDLNDDGYMDVVIGNDHLQRTRIWSPEGKTWIDMDFPTRLARGSELEARDAGARFGIVGGSPVVVLASAEETGAWRFAPEGWKSAPELLSGLGDDFQTVIADQDAGMRLMDLDCDGSGELLVARPGRSQVFRWSGDRWQPTAAALPEEARFVDARGRDAGLRLVDLDDDRDLDAIYSNESRYGLSLFKSWNEGWQTVLARDRGEANQIPMFTRDGTDNGAWFQNGYVWVQNEDTDRLPDLVDRRPVEDLLDGVTPEPKSPEAALAAMRPRSGFEVELVAAEPLVADPIAFDWGPDGRLWVVEMADYNEKEKEAGSGRVRVLSDTDGDGRYDRAEIFLAGLRYPTSVMTWRDGLLVLVPPALIFAQDTDGDGRADRQEELFTGFAKGNPQHQANGLTWGLDNWIYGANGDSGGTIRSVKTGQEAKISGRDFRVRIDDGAVEAIEGYTQFNRNRDDWNNWFGNSNNNPMWQYVLSDHYLSRNPHLAAPDGKVNVSDRPGVAPVYPRSRLLERFNDPHTANHFTSACSANLYRDELFGAGYAGNSFVCEPVHNLVHREVMRCEGIEWHSRRAADEQRSEFLASTDNWFRPTTVRTGPDGALWIADMYRGVIEHSEWIPEEYERKLDVLEGSDRGRIYRVRPVGVPLRKIPELSGLTAEELAGVLESPNGWLRDKAQQLLVERQDRSAVAELERLATSAQRPTARLQALCALEGMAAVNPDVLVRALSDPHPEVRRHAVRIAEPLFMAHGGLQDAVLKLVDDAAPQVRLQLAYSLGEWPHAAAGRALGHLAVRDASDRWILAATMSSAVPHLPVIVDTIVHEARSSQGLAELIGQLLELSAAIGNDETIIKLVPALSLEQEHGYAVWQMSALAELLDLLARRNTTLPEFANQASTELKASIGRLVPVFDFARAVASDVQQTDEARLQAVRLLGRGLDQQAEDIALLAAMLDAGQSEAVRGAAIAALGQINRSDAPQTLLAAWRSYAPQARARVLDVLLAREPGTQALLAAIETGQLQPAEIDTTRRQQLLASRSREIRERAKQLLAENVNADRAQVIESYRTAGLGDGSAAQGGVLFNKHCAVCHRFNEQGHAVGPDLSALTDKSPDALAIAVLDPNRAIESKFISYTAVTNDGLTHTGMLAAESGNSLTLRSQESKEQVLLRSDVEALESSGKSLMPEGFEKDLSPSDLADIIAYVRQNGARPKQFAGNRPEVVRPEPLRNHLFLTPSNAEIYGSSLRIEEVNDNLGYWVGEDDHAIWTIDVPRDMVYAVLLDIACEDASAGNEWLLECAGQRLSGKVETTGDWNKYRRVKVGELQLKAGQHRLGLRSYGPIRGALFDLRSITLIPYGLFVK